MRDSAGRLSIVIKVAGLCTLVLALALPAAGQLTAEDIAALRARGEQEGWTFTVGENPATAVPLEDLCGLVVPEGWEQTANFDPCPPLRDLPAAYDWREVTGCPPVRNQASCGSCWAFATVGSLECNILIVDGVTADLSEQWLVSCNSDYWDCGGGWWAHDYHEWKTDPCGGTGAVLEQYFAYQASDVPCLCPYPHRYWIENWNYIGGGGVPPVDSIKQAILDHGPVTVAVYANSAMQAYNGDVFNGCDSGEGVNHGVVLVGWDDSQGPGGVWFMRNSWGSGWGENGYMRIPYNCSLIGYGACYVVYAGSPSITFDYPEGRPTLASPDEPTTFLVNISTDTGTLIPSSAKLRYSVNGGVYQSTWLTHLGGDAYEAYLPAAACLSTLDWFVRVEEQVIGYCYDPPGAPGETYAALSALSTEILFEDDFETDLGWTVEAGADRGNWERADPEQVMSGEVITQPEDDHSATGALCFVTDPSGDGGAGSYDVDGGPTHLISPAFDLAGTDALVSYWRWYHISTQLDDELVVAVSNDDGNNWVTVETVNDREEWTYAEWRVGDYVTPTAQVRVRFTTDDSPDNSLVEALIDDFTVQTVQCTADADGDGVPDDVDNCPQTYNPDQQDSDSDTYGDACDGCPNDPMKIEPGICGCGVADVDSDGDGTYDCHDGCPDDPNKIEPGICGCGVADVDSDGDGTYDCHDGCPDDPNKIEPGVCGCGVPDVDSDSDGVLDCHDLCPDTEPGVQVNADGCPDCDGNGVYDATDLAQCDGSAWCSDCNENGRLDACDIADESSADDNGNGIPDECETLPGDMNCDGEVDFGDINPFVQALSDPSAYQAQYDCFDNGDVNDDGEVDFGDINAFVALLSD